jgi:nucleoside-diphosphate-sugar epimerase
VIEFVQKNVVGTLMLIEAARRVGVSRFVFISTCAVHEKILDDRPLDEAHPLRATSHYGAHKAAIEKFVHSYGLGDGYPICALRPTGVFVLWGWSSAVTSC